MKKELLSPAGSMEALKQAIYNGCDAVYLAGNRFGARKFATNFSNDELLEAISLCHLYEVKVYVTMNTLIKNEEVASFIEEVRLLHKNGVDAVLVQDIGMICLLREMFPNLEIHSSTQANNSSVDTISFFHKIGVKRVVFSRELTLDEITKIKVPIEKEAFVHGALCVSYSGGCLMSSMLGGRSGNRGECAGSCRLPYILKSNNKTINKGYLLSMKELNTTEEIRKLLNSDITSFKIEGRMKSPLYVAFITSLYRKLIDGEQVDLKRETDKLKTIFNREFTTGHLFNNNDEDLINSKSPNHVGLKIGSCKVIGDKIKIILDHGRTIRQNDAIRFLNSNKGMMVNFLYDEKKKLCNSASNICYVDNKVELAFDDIVTMTQDSSLEKEYLKDKSSRRIPVSFSISALVDKPLKIEISDGTDKITVSGNIVQKSINAPTSKETIEKQLSKLGDSIYRLTDINYEIDNNIFIQIKELNDLRRKLVEELNNKRVEVKTNFVENEISFTKFNNKFKNSLTCSVYTSEQLQTCLNLPFDRIYVRDKKLYELNKDNKKVYYYVPRCSYDMSINKNNKNIISDLGDLKNRYGTYHLNITNIYSAYYLSKMGLLNVPLSCELTKEEINNFIKEFNNKFGSCDFEVFAYGRIENMLIKSNVLGIDNKYYTYTIEDIKKRTFPVYYDGEKTHILNYEKRNELISNVSLYYDFYDETKEEIIKIVKSIN